VRAHERGQRREGGRVGADEQREEAAGGGELPAGGGGVISDWEGCGSVSGVARASGTHSSKEKAPPSSVFESSAADIGWARAKF
jgi:hypothetical protein